MNNYICARWRDANTDPPPHGWIGLNVMASGACYYGACGFMPGDQWLDITDIPAIPRAAVRAAVDDIRDFLKIPSNNKIARAQDQGANLALSSISRFTGISPTEDSK